MESVQEEAKCPTVADRDVAIATAAKMKEKVKELRACLTTPLPK